MILSNFIRRNGKRKGKKANEPRSLSQQQPSSTPSPATSPPVFDIHEDFSISSATQSKNSLMVELDFSDSYEEWFPRELLQSRSPRASVLRTRSATVVQDHSMQGTHADLPSRRQSVRISPAVVFRKKSIPAPIVIPNIIPNIEIGHSEKSAERPCETSRRNTKDASKNPPSPSTSEDLSAISGTTLARLVASSFVLSSSEHRGSRHRSIVRQDSATLPRGEPASLGGSGRSSPIPPVPPVLVSAPSNPNHPVTTKFMSGANTQSDSYITSPETMIDSVIPRRMTRIQEVPSPTISVSTKTSPFPVPETMSQRKVGSVSPCARVCKNSVFDVPTTAIEVPLTSDSQESTRHSHAFLSHDDHSLDEFDFVAPEHLVAIGFPELDSSASFIALQRSNESRGQRKSAVGGANSGVARKHSKKNSPANLALVGQPDNKRLSVEHDYGELLNYDLTLSCGSASSSHSSCTPSSGSAGYQTFPETPMVFSPVWSPPSALLPRSDSQLMRKHSPRLKSAGLRSAKLHSSTRTARRHLDKKNRAVVLRRSRSSLLPTQKLPSPKQAELVLLPSAETKEEGEIRDESNPSSTTNEVESVHAVELQSGVRSHPLARISTSSSYLLEEEALQAFAKGSASSISVLSLILDAPIQSLNSVPIPDSPDTSPSSSSALTEAMTAALSSASPPQPSPTTVVSQPHSSKSALSFPHSWGSSFLPSPPGSSDEFPPELHSSTSVTASSRASNVSMSPSFFPPPPYHTVVSERTPYYPGTTSSPPLSQLPPAEPVFQYDRQASNVSSQSCPNMRTRVGRRPPLPMGPRKPSSPGSVLGSFARSRNGSISSVDSGDGPGKLWRKLQSVASEPPPRFHAPPPKWRGLTLEAAHWTFTSEQLQSVVSQAIQQSSEGSSLRLLRLEVLDGEIADEVHRLELQHTDVKAQYKALVRKRWALMGTLASHIEGEPNDGTSASRIMQELADVLLTLDQLADKMHDIVLQLSQLKSLRDVHNASALALAVRKINGVFVRQMAEKERLQEHVDTLQTERDEAWQHAENIAQDYDTLNERVSDTVWVMAADAIDKASNGSDTQSLKSGRRSARISAVRKSSIYQSQAGLRSSSSKRRSVRSSMSVTRPTSPTEDIPPVPPLPVKTSINSESIGTSRSSYSTNSGISDALALAQAQREVYEMLGLSLPSSQASSRRRTVSWGFDFPEPPPFKSRPMSESLETRTRRVREHSAKRKAIKSAVLDDRPPVGLNSLTFLLSERNYDTLNLCYLSA